jgi:hypothetical protein
MLAKISTRKDNKMLFIEFTYKNVRFRESVLKKPGRTHNKTQIPLQIIYTAKQTLYWCGFADRSGRRIPPLMYTYTGQH